MGWRPSKKPTTASSGRPEVPPPGVARPAVQAAGRAALLASPASRRGLLFSGARRRPPERTRYRVEKVNTSPPSPLQAISVASGASRIGGESGITINREAMPTAGRGLLAHPPNLHGWAIQIDASSVE